ncbi:hypothetical protein DVH24_035610 [Malus domestica]|uniref:Uncharacterized protein n=1 Tax=Malus domestica TaxID=3750 RepID=A0A498JTR8_MALDO|nr:hypothetical protein DVH24_035610 [Malus domestica]
MWPSQILEPSSLALNWRRFSGYFRPSGPLDPSMRRDRTEWNGTRRDKTGQNGEGAKMPSDGNKEEEERDAEVIILCSTDVERVVPGDEAERKFIPNSSRAFHPF